MIMSDPPLTTPPTMPAPLKRDAIIFVPGIGSWTDQSIELVSRKLVVALDRNAKTAEAKFKTEVRYEDDGPNSKKKVCTIHRMDGDQDVAVLDIYDLNYSQMLTKPFENHNLFMKALLVLVAIIKGAIPLSRALRKSSKTFQDKMQLLFAGFILVLLLGYMGLLLVAVYGVAADGVRKIIKESRPQVSGTVKQAPASAPATAAVATPQPAPPATTAPVGLLGSVWSSTTWLTNRTWAAIRWLFRMGASIVILCTALGLFLPDKFRQTLNDAAILFVCLIHYLDVGERRDVLIGKLQDLLEHIAERKKSLQIRHIHIIAYSFGSIITLDAMFPFECEPSERLKSVHTLATIGSPFDVIRSLWPDYFTHRRKATEAPKHWFNVFSPVDVLSSNFNDEPDSASLKVTKSIELAPEPAASPELKSANELPENILYTVGVYKKTLTLPDILSLEGFRNHTMYWDPAAEGEDNCFATLMRKMYAADPLLG